MPRITGWVKFDMDVPNTEAFKRRAIYLLKKAEITHSFHIHVEEYDGQDGDKEHLPLDREQM